jgi:hypothetical protein
MNLSVTSASVAVAAALTIGGVGPAHADDAGTAQLIGAASAGTRILIRKIDDGPILWDAPGKPATHASVAAGRHSVSVMCQVTKSGASMMVPGQLSLDAEAGRIYDVSGEVIANSLRCDVSAKPRS